MSDTELFEIVRELTARVENLETICDERHDRVFTALGLSSDRIEYLRSKSLATYLHVCKCQSAKMWNGNPPDHVLAAWSREWEAFGKPVANPIPQGIYYSADSGNFYDMWRDRRDEFPSEDTDAKPAPIFEDGDLVECITAEQKPRSSDLVSRGQRYFVAGVDVNLLTLEGSDRQWHQALFKLIEKAKRPETVLRTPKEWAEKHGFTILDADGWNDGANFNDPLREDQFLIRASRCTCRGNLTALINVGTEQRKKLVTTEDITAFAKEFSKPIDPSSLKASPEQVEAMRVELLREKPEPKSAEGISDAQRAYEINCPNGIQWNHLSRQIQNEWRRFVLGDCSLPVPDDAEPITEEWLLSVGFEEGTMEKGRVLMLENEAGIDLIVCCYENPFHCLGTNQIRFRTRRDIRLFAELMRIELKETK